MKPSTPIHLVTAAVAIPALLLTGCQTSNEPIADKSPTSTPSETATETPTPTPSPTETTVSYTDPSQADTYCGAIEDLVTLNDESSKQDQSTIVDQMGTRLDLLVAGTAHIGKLGPDDAAQEWKATSDEYSQAADLFKSSGGQVSNTDFLRLLSSATKTANATYEHQADSVEDECGIDITKLIAEEK